MLRSPATADPSHAELPMNIAILDNDTAKRDYEITNDTPIEISESEKTAYGNEWRTYQD